VRSKLFWVVAAMLAVFGPARQASADIFQATFTGTYAGPGVGFFILNGQLVPYDSIIGDTYTATFLFNSDRGTLSSPSPGVEQLSGSGPTSPSLGAVVVIDGGALGRIVGGSNGSDLGILSWQTDGLGDLNIIQAVAQSGGGFNDVDIGPVGEFPPFAKCAPGSMCGFFQSGPCPGEPCGFLNVSSATLVDLSVPGPAAGAGLPGLLLAVGGLFTWWRRRENQSV
jgi:hypothetical protein